MYRRLGFIGGGMMATAIIKSLLRREYPGEKLLVSDPDPKRMAELGALGVKTYPGNQEMIAEAEGVLLAVKPQVVEEVFGNLRYHKEIPLISIVAGFSTGRLERLLPDGTRVIRAMPNTPALIQQGVTALARGKHAGDEDLKWGEEIMGALGRVVVVPERLMDAVTALSGSGPGFVYKFIEALIDAGVLVGLPRPLARELAVQTVIGSAKMVAEYNEHPGALRDMVTSPGGTTITGLAELESGGFSGLVMKAVKAAAEKSEELGKK